VHLFFLLLFGALAGCHKASPTAGPTPEPHRGTTLRVACPAPASAPSEGEPRLTDPAAAVRAWGQAWAGRRGATLQVQTYDPKVGPPAASDVWVLPPAELPRWAAAGAVLPLPSAMTRHDAPFGWTDLLPDDRDPLLSWAQTAYAVPLLGEAPVCCYRADRLADRAVREAFRKRHGRDPGPPATWEQFAELAEFFAEHDHRPSLPPLPADDRMLDRLFYAVAAGYARRAVRSDEPAGEAHVDEVFSFHYDLKTGRPRIDTPGFVHALGLLQRLQKCRPAADPVPERTFLRGEAVLCLTDACWVAAFQRNEKLRDRVGVGPVPGGDRYFEFATGQERPVKDANRVPYLGGAGWVMAVPKGAADAGAAFDLLGDLAGRQTSGQLVQEPLWGGGPVREEQLRRERWDAYDLDRERTQRLQEVLREALLHRGIKNPVLCLRTPWEAGHRAALDGRLREALQGKAAAEALRAAAGRWAEMDREAGVEKHRADYSISLGLLAR
jgi:ABC-type glycerol-3-phosphate transport system substrate-binding protein